MICSLTPLQTDLFRFNGAEGQNFGHGSDMTGHTCNVDVLAHFPDGYYGNEDYNVIKILE